jgi:hypothetical protein
MDSAIITYQSAIDLCQSAPDEYEFSDRILTVSRGTWETAEEYYRFLQLVSIELLESSVNSQAEVFGFNMDYTDWLSSPFLDLWALSLVVYSEPDRRRIDLQELEGNVSSALDPDSLELVAIIPLVAVQDYGFWEVLLSNARDELTFEQEEFLGYAMGSLKTCDVETPMEIFPILGIPSPRILKEDVLADWRWFPELWTPRGILQCLQQNKHVDGEIKSLVSRILRCEGMDEDEAEEWRDHADVEWSHDEITEALNWCAGSKS